VSVSSLSSLDLGALFRALFRDGLRAGVCVCVAWAERGEGCTCVCRGGRDVHVCVDDFRARALSHHTHILSRALSLS
jgi:hypothetical protein